MAYQNILVRVGADVNNLQKNLGRAGTLVTDFGLTIAALGTMGVKTFSTLSAASALGIGFVVKQAADFEYAFADVRKVLDGTEEDFAALSKGIREMSKEVPVATNDIASIAAVAGQLGIETKNILQFTRVMVDLGVATNMSSEEAATALARLANITGMSMKDIDRLGSTVVDLGNNLATTEREIVEMGQRLAGAGTQIGLTEAQILAFSGALSSVGIRIEAGGTAFSRVFLDMNTAVMNGGKELKAFAKVANVSSQEFAKAFEDDAATAIMMFIEGLGRIKEEGGNTAAVLADLGLSDQRVRDSLLRAAEASDVFNDSLEIGNKAWKENVALADEVENRYGTVISRLKILYNRVKDVTLAFGIELLEAFHGVLDVIEPYFEKLDGLVEKFESLDDKTKRSIAIMIALVPVFFGALAAISGVFVVVGMLVAGVGALWTVLAGIGISFAAFIKIIIVAGSAILGIVTAISLAIGGFISLMVYSEDFRDRVIGAFWAVYDTAVFIFESVKNFLLSVWDGVTEFWAENSKTIEGYFVEAFDLISNTISRVIDVIVDLYEYFSWFSSGDISDVFSFLSDLFNEMEPVFSLILDVLYEIGESIVEAFELVSDTIKPLLPSLVTLGKIIGGVVAVQIGIFIGLLVGVASAVGPLIEAIANLWAIVANAFGFIISLLTGDFSRAWEHLKSIGTATLGFFLGLIESVLDFVSGFVAGVVEFFMSLYNTLVGNSIIPDMVNEIVEWFVNLYNSIIDVVSSIVEWVIDKFDLIYTTITSAFTLVSEVVESAWEFIVKTFENALDFLVSLVTLDFEGMKDAIDKQMSDSEKLLSDIWSAIDKFMVGILGEIWSNVKNKFTEIKETITEKIEGAKSAAVEKFTEMVSDAKRKAQEIVNAARDKFEEVKRTIRTKLSEAVNEVGRKIGEMPSRVKRYIGGMVQAGRDLISGLIRGIGSMASSVWSKAREIASGIGDSIRRTLGVQSPSRVAIDIMKWVGRGLIVGMEREVRAVERMADELAHAAAPDLSTVDIAYNSPYGSYTTLQSALHGTVDVNSRDEALVLAINELRRDITNLRVIMDEREVGRIVEPHVTENQDRNNRIRDAFR